VHTHAHTPKSGTLSRQILENQETLFAEHNANKMLVACLHVFEYQNQ